MKSITLFEDGGYVRLLPLVYWRSVFELRVGRKIVLDRTAQRLGLPVSGVWTRHELARVAAQRCGAPANQGVEAGTILVNGRWLPAGPFDFPDPPCVGVIDETVAFVVCDAALSKSLTPEDLLDPSRCKAELHGIPKVAASGTVFHYPWDLVRHLVPRLNKVWRDADASNDGDVASEVIGNHANRIHVGEGTAIHRTVVLDPSEGPIYISHDVRIGPYCVVEGPAYIGPGTRIHPHAWLHGGNAIGPMCKIGGEVDGCIIDGYTNKQHEGFLGHSYVGCWVNIGAGATNSDLKNTYGRVRVPVNGREVDTGLQFFGAIIGDHAKIGINATIPTGAMIGFASVVNASKTAPKYVPSFSWVTDERMGAGNANRLLDLAAAVLARRNVDMSDDEVELFLELQPIARQHEARA